MKREINLPKFEATGKSPLCQRNRILVVHDDGDIRELSAELLARSGYDVNTAIDGAAAQQAMNESSYDLMITNCLVSELSGAESLKKPKGAPKEPPVIVVLTNSRASEMKQSPSLRPVVTLLMPFTVAEFLGTVKCVLRAPAMTLK
jgi:DNA-binding response OmpR family regulator